MQGKSRGIFRKRASTPAYVPLFQGELLVLLCDAPSNRDSFCESVFFVVKRNEAPMGMLLCSTYGLNLGVLRKENHKKEK